MSNASHADQPDGGEHHLEEGGQASSYRHTVNEHPLEFVIRATAGIIGLLLIVLTLQHVTQPPLAAKTIDLLQSATGQWLAVAVLAILLLIVAARGQHE